MVSEVHNIDCMEFMQSIPDQYFDLAVVDPPYGIQRSNLGTRKRKGWKSYAPKDWDDAPPDKRYFEELFRVSQNQVIFGGNYFTLYLPPSMGWIVWNKGQKLTMSDGELAYTSFNKALRIITLNRVTIGKYGGHIHPTQKPVDLYHWIFSKYGKPEAKILDTHLGSGSSRIAAYLLGLNFWGCEKDKEYFELQETRFAEQCKMKIDFVK